MTTLTQGRHRNFVSYVRKEVENYSEIKVMVEYTKGGYNYFSGNYNKRGYRVSIKPVNRGDGVESFTLLSANKKKSGGYVFVEEANRFNKKRLKEIAEIIDSRIDEIANAYAEDRTHELNQLCKIEGARVLNRPQPKKPEVPQMKLLTKEIENKMPKLYANEEKDPEEVKIIAKFFHCWSNWAWYVTEGEKRGDDFLFFGYVRGLDNELGYFSLNELKKIKVKGLPIERDRHFGDHTLAEVMEKRL